MMWNGIEGGAKSSDTPIHDVFESAASTDEKLCQLLTLISSGHEINKTDRDGNTPLHLATRDQCSKTINLLLHNSANAKLANNRGITPLHNIAEYGMSENFECVLKLILQQVDINAKCSDGNTPLSKSVFFNNKVFAEILIRNGADVKICNNDSISPFHHAVLNGNMDIVKALVQADATIINLPLGPKMPIQIVLSQSELNYEIAEIIVQAKCDLKCLLDNGSGMTPLLQLVSRPTSVPAVNQKTGFMKVCELMLENGAVVNHQDKYRYSALMYAAKLQWRDLILLLLDHGADASLRNVYNESALDLIADDQSLKKLLSHKQDEHADHDVFTGASQWLTPLKFQFERDKDVNPDERKKYVELINELESGIFTIERRKSAKRKMLPEHKQKLRQHRKSLVDEMTPKDLFNHFIEKEVLTDDDIDEIKVEKTRRAMSEKLLDILVKRGEHAYTVLCKALTDNGQEFLVDLLQLDHTSR